MYAPGPTVFSREEGRGASVSRGGSGSAPVGKAHQRAAETRADAVGDETGVGDRAHLSGSHPNLARLARRARDERHRARPAPGADAK